MRLKNIILEGDSLQVIKAITDDGKHWTSTGMLVSDIKCILFCFAHWLANHVRREANEISHVLARKGLNISTLIVDMEVGPPCIKSLLRRI